ncbi:MAG: hypothetical protein ACTSRZ_19560 [Promethearchaeota archaeon]
MHILELKKQESIESRLDKKIKDLKENQSKVARDLKKEKKEREGFWIQKAVKPSTKGDFTEWCKKQGFKGVCQECINLAAKKGGRPAKMALFAANVSKGKFTYPSKKE